MVQGEKILKVIHFLSLTSVIVMIVSLVQPQAEVGSASFAQAESTTGSVATDSTESENTWFAEFLVEPFGNESIEIQVTNIREEEITNTTPKTRKRPGDFGRSTPGGDTVSTRKVFVFDYKITDIDAEIEGKVCGYDCLTGSATIPISLTSGPNKDLSRIARSMIEIASQVTTEKILANSEKSKREKHCLNENDEPISDLDKLIKCANKNIEEWDSRPKALMARHLADELMEIAKEDPIDFQEYAEDLIAIYGENSNFGKALDRAINATEQLEQTEHIQSRADDIRQMKNYGTMLGNNPYTSMQGAQISVYADYMGSQLARQVQQMRTQSSMGASSNAYGFGELDRMVQRNYDQLGFSLGIETIPMNGQEGLVAGGNPYPQNGMDYFIQTDPNGNNQFIENPGFAGPGQNPYSRPGFGDPVGHGNYAMTPLNNNPGYMNPGPPGLMQQPGFGGYGYNGGMYAGGYGRGAIGGLYGGYGFGRYGNSYFPRYNYGYGYNGSPYGRSPYYGGGALYGNRFGGFGGYGQLGRNPYTSGGYYRGGLYNRPLPPVQYGGGYGTPYGNPYGNPYMTNRGYGFNGGFGGSFNGGITFGRRY